MSAVTWLVVGCALIATHLVAFALGRRLAKRGRRGDLDELERLRSANETLTKMLERREEQLDRKTDEEARTRPTYVA